MSGGLSEKNLVGSPMSMVGSKAPSGSELGPEHSSEAMRARPSDLEGRKPTIIDPSLRNITELVHWQHKMSSKSMGVWIVLKNTSLH